VRRSFRWAWVAVVLATVACSASPKVQAPVVVRVGYFPNITHAQAVIGMADGTYQKALGAQATLDAKVFNAGPSAIEAMFAGQLDISYIGPNPAINGWVKSKGEALQIIAGATSGGAVLVVREGSGIESNADFRGKRIASPQLGNTQDVALRAWLMAQGFTLKDKGGATEVVPVSNPDILTLFLKKEIDAAWVPEPWGARLVREANGRIFLDERELWPEGQFVVAHVIVSRKFLQAHPDLVKRFLTAHVELTQRINADPATAKQKLNQEIERLTGAALAQEVLDDAWSRQTVTWDPISSSLLRSAESAFELGFLGETHPDLDGIYNLELLNAVLKDKGLAQVK
jgi:NitT/TauT family transport system substrate-binding protein